MNTKQSQSPCHFTYVTDDEKYYYTSYIEIIDIEILN